MAQLSTTRPATARGTETRRRIFDAAVTEYAQNGYAGARIDRIAAAAAVNKQRIYAYFGDKEGLFEEVWQQTASLIMEEDDELSALTAKDIPRLGRILLSRNMEFHERHPEFWRIFVLENLMESRHSRRPSATRPYEHVRLLYEEGQATGIHDPAVSFESFLFVVIAVTFFYASNSKTMSETLTVDLSDHGVRARVFSEISRWLFGEKNNESPWD